MYIYIVIRFPYYNDDGTKAYDGEEGDANRHVPANMLPIRNKVNPHTHTLTRAHARIHACVRMHIPHAHTALTDLAHTLHAEGYLQLDGIETRYVL